MSEAVLSDRAPQDVRPVIITGNSGNWGAIAFAGVLAVGGLMIYSALSASEEAAQAPSVFAPEQGAGGRIASPPPLQTPDRFRALPQAEVALREETPPAPPPRIVPPFVPRVIERGPPLPPVRNEQPARPVTTASQSSDPRVVFDAAATPSLQSANRSEADGDERVSASRLLNPSRTIPQGTVIPAVLETALDSTRAGGVRALVQRDVLSFDGTRVLIPRGSRLYGEYEARLERGQNRALVQWTRLIRPDGVTIALDSPSSDPLGRAGIRGKVDSKFLQRFGGAILQSALDIGVGVAVNRATDGVIVALPGSTQNVQITEPESIQPTLKVKHGTSVSVFVARDLDFSSVDP